MLDFLEILKCWDLLILGICSGCLFISSSSDTWCCCALGLYLWLTVSSSLCYYYSDWFSVSLIYCLFNYNYGFSKVLPTYLSRFFLFKTYLYSSDNSLSLWYMLVNKSADNVVKLNFLITKTSIIELVRCFMDYQIMYYLCVSFSCYLTFY